jgi:hypothetical protein
MAAWTESAGPSARRLPRTSANDAMPLSVRTTTVVKRASTSRMASARQAPRLARWTLTQARLVFQAMSICRASRACTWRS